MSRTAELVPSRAHQPRPFRLMRFFSLASLVGLVVVTSCLIWAYRELTERHMVDHETNANADLTQAFSNAVWERHRAFVHDAHGRSRDALLADPRLAQLSADVLTQMRGLGVAKVKVYGLDGMTVFSTDPRQIGEDKSANPGFRRALAGDANGQITWRERFDAFEGVLNNRSLIASYIPARAAPGAPVEGVFEVYSDVTALLAAQRAAQWQVAGLVSALLALLYGFLLVVIRKADHMIRNQERERALHEEAIRHQAYHDALTGLPNRTGFPRLLRRAVADASRQRQQMAVMFIDLDGFKTVNDELGHDAGDLLLQSMAQRIKSCVRADDAVFRMGGDEFTVILPTAAIEDASRVARRIVEAASRPFELMGRSCEVGASVGIALYANDDSDAESLLRHADAAMYAAKRAGRGRFMVHRGAAMLDEQMALAS